MAVRMILFVFLAAIMSGLWATTCVVWRAAEVGELVQTLEPRKFERLTVLAVGTGGPYENRERLGPSTGIGYGDRVMLVDAGRGVAEALRTSQVPVSQPDAIFLTNLLPLNTVGLDDLLFTGWRGPRDQPIRLFGPVGTHALADGIMAAFARSAAAEGAAMDLPTEGARFEVIEVGDGFVLEEDGLKIEAREITGGPIAALAWRFEAISRSVVVSGTGWSEDQLVEFASGANMLVHEAVIIPPAEDAEEAGILVSPERLRREAEMHTSLYDVGGMATRAGVETLVLIKLRPPPFFDLQITGAVAQTFDGAVELPADGDEYKP